MTGTAKGLLLLEVAICFLPMTLLLLLGVLMVPSQLGFVIAGEWSGMFLIAIVLMGISGLVALFIVLRWLLIRPSHPLNARFVLLLMCLGILPLLPYAFAGDTVTWRVVGALPLICTAHVAYLAREYLFGVRIPSEE
jgi:predicted membrane channel-forming protein YqfA (hemolysin III family)